MTDAIRSAVRPRRIAPFSSVRDWRPETVLLPPGTFVMGSPDDEDGRLAVEGPQRLVTIAKPFAIGKFPVTVEQFAAFAAECDLPVGTCKKWNGTVWPKKAGSFLRPGFAQTGDHPAVCVSWEDAQAYVAWLTSKSGRRFRLLTEAEWEYAARARSVTPFWWGTSITPDQAHYNAADGGNGGSGNQGTVPADRFEPNLWGLYQMHGNVWEWVEDCWSRSHVGASKHGSARPGRPTCKRVLRGGSWLNGPRGLRSARRHAAHPDFRRSDVGFRVAETLEVTTRSGWNA